ncbi:MAG: hypothetical protein K5657_05840 [Desulfovibrio sp.]|nr:hypothetical protein [Desulfovibrio sp.]
MTTTVHLYEYAIDKNVPNGSVLTEWRIQKSSAQKAVGEDDFILTDGFSVGQDSKGIKHVYDDYGYPVEIVTRDGAPYIRINTGPLLELKRDGYFENPTSGQVERLSYWYEFFDDITAEEWGGDEFADAGLIEVVANRKDEEGYNPEYGEWRPARTAEKG